MLDYRSRRRIAPLLSASDVTVIVGKVRELSLSSWNFIGQDPKQFRHYGPMAQDFFAAFGHDAVGAIGTETTITSRDIEGILMIATEALEKRTMEQHEELKALRAEDVRLRSLLEALEREKRSPRRAARRQSGKDTC